MPVHVGTSGWQYDDWKERFYPPEVPKRSWLEYYAEQFATVELDSTFYRLPKEETFASWRERSPEGFCYAVKASRFLTHIRRLREPEEPVERLLERARFLGDRLGPVLVQLPPDLKADLDRLDETLTAFGRSVRVAFEPRHESWFTGECRSVLERHGAALCLADPAPSRAERWRTADWGYVRFHCGRASPFPCYGRRALASWAERIAAMWKPDEDVFVYFNNDTLGCAPRDAARFAPLLERAGLEPTRTPSTRRVRAG